MQPSGLQEINILVEIGMFLLFHIMIVNCENRNNKNLYVFTLSRVARKTRVHARGGRVDKSPAHKEISITFQPFFL